MTTISILVKGKVQGVFFRQRTKETAQRLGITGTVKNNDDGSLSIIASGEKDRLDEFTEWCHTGPSRAKVESVHTTVLEHKKFPSFEIIR